MERGRAVRVGIEGRIGAPASSGFLRRARAPGIDADEASRTDKRGQCGGPATPSLAARGEGARLGPTCALGRSQFLANAVASAIVEKEFEISSGDFVKIAVEEGEENQQTIRLLTSHKSPGLILHWGLEGGKGYKGGWRLPDKRFRPKDTVQYKNRALQTRWRSMNGNGTQQINICLEGEEMSDALNFVLKDEACGAWYDDNGSNFKVALKPEAPAATQEYVQDIASIPQELAGIWAYLKWEYAGCPNRSEAEADAEYRSGISEMQQCLAKGVSVDELWRVARGEIKFDDFRQSNGLEVAAPPPPALAPSPPAEPSSDVAAPVAEPMLEAPFPVKEVEVGEGRGMMQREYLDLIKDSDPPNLSAEKMVRKEKPLDFLVQNAAVDQTTKWRRLYPLGSNVELLVVVQQESRDSQFEVTLTTDAPFPLLLHWGIMKPDRGKKWYPPPEALWPLKSTPHSDGKATNTDFQDCEDEECDVEILGSKVPLQRIRVFIPKDDTVSGLQFVLTSEDGTRWWRDSTGNFMVPLPGVKRKGRKSDQFSEFKDELTRTMVDLEVNSGGWTMMHRFNKSAELIGQALDGYFEGLDLADAMARIYVWLRYSATRQLTWQRNYNTKPRELSHSQESLCQAIVRAYGESSQEAQEWVRMMLSTVGRGGDGQKIRDEILHIMHRNNIKEVKGNWMEEWHQKLHNNTTPDDVDICEAYIAFLETGGDVGAYWRRLADGGISRQRLESFERAIVQEPEYYPDKRDNLIKDFYNYLGILKAVHSGADLQASAGAVQHALPASAQGHLGYVLSHLGDQQILPLMEAAVEARAEIRNCLKGNRDMLYLDLALEGQVRQAAERGASISGMQAACLVTPLLYNLCLSVGKNEEAVFCLRSWQALPDSVRGGYPNQEEALQAVAVIDRMRRALGEVSDGVFNRIGDVSVSMGKAMGCEDWAVDLFCEEVVRGGPGFALSLVLGNVEGAFRAEANLGAWQIISPSNVLGRVATVDDLHRACQRAYGEPTVLVVSRVTGEEEIPDGVVGVLSPDAPDVLSHVSVRARNMKVLFASCYEKWRLEEVAKKEGALLSFYPTASGEVKWEEALAVNGTDSSNGANATAQQRRPKVSVPRWSRKWAVSMDDYTPEVVGAKSRNIAGLRQKLPDWVQLPASVTIPFGSFEAALDTRENRDVKKKLQEAMKRVPDHPSVALKECRNLAMQVHVPDDLRASLSSEMSKAGIPLPGSEERWEQAYGALRGVWASKYNDRAYLSMRKVGLRLSDLRMAVLVQSVVPAHYAFVIHTKNPATGDDGEVYCELVLGLGESLVSGMVPGSSIAFSARKSDLDRPQVLLYPSKSSAMFVQESLIFRSDSNGEDLEGYAGAGLYESITMDAPELRRVDYTTDRVIYDAKFRKSLFARICKVGVAIEEALGSAQDVEGVVGPPPYNVITVVQTRPQV